MGLAANYPVPEKEMLWAEEESAVDARRREYSDTHGGSSEEASATREATAASGHLHQRIEKGVDVFQRAEM